MTATLLPPDAPASGHAHAGTDRWGRFVGPWSASTGRWCRHLAALTAVLFGVFLLIGPGRIMTADEGAAMAQAKVIESTGGWAMHQDRQLDPAGRWDAVHMSDDVGDLRYPFVRNPPYALLVTWADEVGGATAAVGLSLVGLILCALGTGRLAELIRPGRGLQAMWLAGLLSPLFFDGYWILAHSLAAAAGVWAVLGVVRFVARGSRGWIVPIVGGLTVAAGLRSEGMLFALAVALGSLVLGSRGSWRRPVVAALGAVAAAAVAAKGLRIWQSTIEGGRGVALYRPTYGGTWLSGRVGSFGLTMFGSSDDGSGGWSRVALLVAATCVIVAVVAARRGALGRGPIVVLGVVGMLAAVSRLFLPSGVVPGLVLTAPLLVAAVLATPRSAWTDRRLVAIGIAASAFVAAVALTQWARGGVEEWGGRYFHLALPLIVVIAVVSLDDLVLTRPALARAALPGALAVSLALSVLAVRTHYDERRSNDRIVTAAWQMAVTHDHSDRAPVIVSSWIPAGRFSWMHVLDGRYLTVPDPADLTAVAANLRAAGIDRFTFIGVPGRELGAGSFPGFAESRVERLGDGWFVAELVDRSRGG